MIVLLDIIKKLIKYLSGNMENHKDINYYLDNYNIKPYSEAIRIAVLYGIAGALWILLSDELLSKLVPNVEAFKKFATYKGWVYVLVTMLLIYSLVLKRLLLFEKAIQEILNNIQELNASNEELNASNEELMALEEELREQFYEQKLIENKLNSLAYFDSLTELPNRASFERKINNLINKKYNSSRKFALVYMDIDNFKNINDTLGHASGNLFLKDISSILKEKIKSPDFVARLGGDEFALIFQNVEDRMDVTNRVQNLLKHLRRHWIIDKQEFFISFSLGISMYPEHGDNLDMLLRNADIAMYFVKKNMKDDYSFYFDEMQDKNLKQIKTINDLYHAIDNKEFVLYYQPIINLKNGRLIGVEALIRWIHPTKGMIPPMEFIPLAEETGLIYEICKWVFNTALMQKVSWEQQGYNYIKMSINVSGKRITHEKFLEDVNKCVLEAGVRCDEIQLEVTETAVIQDLEASMKILKKVKDMGMKIALDDFGTGYSSLTYIQKLPIDVVKLDRDFIKGISNNGQDKLIIQSIIRLVHDLNLEIVAEGIETKEQEAFLKQNHCDYGQGYLFSKPITKEEIEELFLKNIKNL